MALKRGTVQLEDYSSTWKESYETEEKLLKDVLKNKIIEIHHVGSTSVPGLKAKPIVDILIVLKSLDEIDEIERLLKSHNYENCGQHGITDQYFFAKGPDEARSHYIHFTVPKSKTYYDSIYFRNYLIDHPEYLKKYSNIKQELALKYADERPKYTQGKSEFISNVIKLAKEEYDN